MRIETKVFRFLSDGSEWGWRVTLNGDIVSYGFCTTEEEAKACAGAVLVATVNAG